MSHCKWVESMGVAKRHPLVLLPHVFRELRVVINIHVSPMVRGYLHSLCASWRVCWYMVSPLILTRLFLLYDELPQCTQLLQQVQLVVCIHMCVCSVDTERRDRLLSKYMYMYIACFTVTSDQGRIYTWGGDILQLVIPCSSFFCVLAKDLFSFQSVCQRLSQIGLCSLWTLSRPTSLS